MKKIVFLISLLLCCFSCFSQEKRYYSEIKGIEKELSSGLKIVFDFGDNPVYSSWNGLRSNQKLVNGNGEEIEFNSMVDAGNYLSEKGWTFLQAYTSFYSGNSIIHWIFYKDSEDPETVLDGIVTKAEYKKKSKK